MIIANSYLQFTVCQMLSVYYLEAIQECLRKVIYCLHFQMTKTRLRKVNFLNLSVHSQYIFYQGFKLCILLYHMTSPLDIICCVDLCYYRKKGDTDKFSPFKLPQNSLIGQQWYTAGCNLLELLLTSVDESGTQ